MAVQLAKAFDVWSETDDDGFRDYHIIHKVQTTTPLVNPAGAGWAGDGPQQILTAVGLPVVGDTWNFGNEADPWAFCRPNKTVRPLPEVKGNLYTFYSVESLFSNRPLDRCMSTNIDDPLDEPQRIRGNSVRYTLEAFKDRNGDVIANSAHEPFRGPQVEFDGGRDQVIIEQNVADLELGLVTSLKNKLNDDTLWGLTSRRVKLSDFFWEQLWYGSCIYYYKRIFTFDIRNNPEDLFDRALLDEGTKVLSGRWRGPDDCDGEAVWIDVPICSGPGGPDPDPDPDNPQHFIRYKDKNGENTRVILDGKGRPANSSIPFGTGSSTYFGTDSTDQAHQMIIEYYDEADLTQLNIPLNLDFGTAAS